jgi:hypothetical protein
LQQLPKPSRLWTITSRITLLLSWIGLSVTTQPRVSEHVAGEEAMRQLQKELVATEGACELSRLHCSSKSTQIF